MSVFAKFRNAISQIISGLSSPASWFSSWLNAGTETDSDITLTESNVIGWAPVWYAVSRIAGHVSTLPITPMKRLDRGAEKDMKHPAYRLVRSRPNPFISAAQFWETFAAHALLYGNAKAAVIRDRSGRPIELILMHPAKSVTAYIDGEKWHAVRVSGNEDDRLVAMGGTEDSKFSESKDWIKIPDRDVLHLPGLGMDGVGGLVVFEVSRNTFGLGLAAEKAVSKDFANGSAPGVILTAPTGVLRNDEAAKRFVNQFDRFHSGVDKRNRTALLRDGITATILSKSNRDAEWVPQRVFQRQEVALIFGLESILGDDASVSYGSAEQKDLAYHKNTLAKWLVKIEQECDEKLLTEREKRLLSHFFKFNAAALLRTDYKSTMDALSVGIASRIISPNEAREKLDMNPYEGGDEYENPHISPGAAEERDAETQDTSTSSNRHSPEEVNRIAMINHLKHLIGVETKQVSNAAAGKGNFLAWLDMFYGKKFRGTLSDAIDSLGGDRSIAVDYCNRSYQELLEIAGIVTADGLPNAVAEVVSSWPQRAEKLASDILGELINV